MVDAKTPLDAYMDAAEAHGRRIARARAWSVTRSRWKNACASSARRVTGSSSKHSPEFAVLFLPGDQFLSAALAERPDLIDSALKQRIIVTTPSTLMALLKVIAYGWRQTMVTENAREIRELGQDLHKRLNVFVNHLQKVGRSLGNAVESFNAAVGSMERNVMPQARKFPELGATADAAIEPVDPIEQAVRTLAATDAGNRRSDGYAREHSRIMNATISIRASTSPAPDEFARPRHHGHRRGFRHRPRRGAGAGRGRRRSDPARPHGAQARSGARGNRRARRPEASIVPLDLERALAADYEAVAAAVEKRYGRLDGLLHNAALLGALTPIEQYDVPMFMRVMHVNVTAAFVLTQHLLPLLRASKDAAVLFTSSGVRQARARLLGRIFDFEVRGGRFHAGAGPRTRRHDRRAREHHRSGQGAHRDAPPGLSFRGWPSLCRRRNR